jgi:tRNA pseudouridine13 synthase
VPNYFGTQRFGWQGGNLGEARDYAARKALPEQRNVRSRLLSTARSYLFNQVLAARVADGSLADGSGGRPSGLYRQPEFLPRG